MDFAKELVDLAVESGADAVKFQLRDLDALYRQRGGATAGEDLGVQYTLDLLSRFSLSVEQMYEVFDHVQGAWSGYFVHPLGCAFRAGARRLRYCGHEDRLCRPDEPRTAA